MNFFSPLLIFLCSSHWIGAVPFALNDPASLRTDYSFSWSSLSQQHGDLVFDWQSLPVPGQGNLTVYGYSESEMSIHNNDTNGGLFTSGVLLANPGPEGLSLYPPAPVQGFGVTVEHFQGVQASYTLSVWTSSVELIKQVTVQSPGTNGNPTFVGIVDPEARIGIVSINASPGNFFAITDPLFQLRIESESDPNNLPITSQATMAVSSGVTYLHEGRKKNSIPVPATENASEDNANTCDLLADFPEIRGGDILRLERQSLIFDDGRPNHLLGVFSSSEEISKGTDLKRLPGALNAGTDYYTKTKSSGVISKPTNIPEDFVVSDSSFLEVPAGAKFLMFSLAEPSDELRPTSVQLSLIQRTPFLDWVQEQGLYGPLAELESDLDGDGLTLIEEYAFRKNPTLADAHLNENPFAAVPELVSSDPSAPIELKIGFGGRANAPLVYSAEFSSDLVVWDPAPADSFFEVATDSGAGAARFLFVDPEPGPRRFGRVKVDYLPPPSQ